MNIICVEPGPVGLARLKRQVRRLAPDATV